MKKVMLLFFIFVFFVTTVAVSFGASAETKDVEMAKNSKAAYACDWNSGTEIYASNPTKRLPIASMCKIMTLLLCFEAERDGKISFDDEITISGHAAGMGGSQVFLEENGKYPVGELIKSICIASANDSCVAMAETLAGSEELFVKRMNKRANELGMLNTSFSNCTGLPKEGQYSCAKDVAVMLSELLKNEKYFNYSTIWMDEMHHSGDRITQMANTNKLIRYYQGCDAGKTGYTSEAGFCLAASAKRGNMRVVSVVIGGADSKSRFGDVSEMFDYAFANFTSKCVLEQKVIQDTHCTVKGGKLREITVIPERPAYVFCSKNEDDNVTFEIEVSEMRAPVYKGDCVGKITIYKNGVETETISIMANEESCKKSYWDSLHDIAINWEI